MTFKPTGKPLNDYTIHKDKAVQKIGWVAEREFAILLMEQSITFNWTGPDELDFDFVVKSLDKKITIDVKAKGRNFESRDNFDAHVYMYRSNAECEIYVFSNVILSEGFEDDEEPKKVELVGWIQKERFWWKARLVWEGQRDGPYIEKRDAGKLKYADLLPMDLLLKYLKGEQ